MEKMMKLFGQPSNVIGLMGSTMSNKEQGCLMKVFQASPIRFPTLAQMDFDKKIHLKDEITTTSQKDFITRLYSLVKAQCQLTPVIIVGG